MNSMPPHFLPQRVAATPQGYCVPMAQDPLDGSTDQPSPAGFAPAVEASIGRMLQIVRAYLGMEVAFVARFEHGERIFEHVIADDTSIVQPGHADPLEDSFCQRVADGRVATVVTDAGRHPELRDLPAQRAIGVGGHVSAPVVLPDGSLHGTVCAFDTSPSPHLVEDHGRFLVAVGRLLGEMLADGHAERERTRLESDALEAVLADGRVRIVYQPVVSSRTGRAAGFEALSRFDALPLRPPDEWFAAAARTGRNVDLELLAIRCAIVGAERLPSDAYLAVNASPMTFSSPALLEVVEASPRRIVVELTEHEAVADYARLASARNALQVAGARVALDDGGAGYAGLATLAELRPDIVKLDRSLITTVDTSPVRRALATAIVSFAAETAMQVVAEGVETVDEFETLIDTGVNHFQGFLFSAPGSPEELPDSWRISRGHRPQPRA